MHVYWVGNSWDPNTIRELPDDRFELISHIPVVYEQWSRGSVVAAFEWDPNTIRELPDDRFELISHIPVVYEQWSRGSVVATFEEADISISGSSRKDAHELLAHWVVDLFGDLLDEPPETLGGDLTRKLNALRGYIRRVDD